LCLSDRKMAAPSEAEESKSTGNIIHLVCCKCQVVSVPPLISFGRDDNPACIMLCGRLASPHEASCQISHDQPPVVLSCLYYGMDQAHPLRVHWVCHFDRPQGAEKLKLYCLRHGIYEYKLRVDEFTKDTQCSYPHLLLHENREPRWHLIHPAVITQVGLKITGEIHHINLLVPVP